MAEHEKEKQLDEILDSLLANYSSAEPRPGLETRILANLNGAAARADAKGWWNLKWFWVGAVAAVMIVCALLIHRWENVSTPNNVVVEKAPVVQHPGVEHVTPRPIKRVKNRRRKSPVPRQPENTELALNQRPAVFPTPTPLSEQERLLFTYLANTPHEVVVAQIQRNDQKEAKAFWEGRDE